MLLMINMLWIDLLFSDCQQNRHTTSRWNTNTLLTKTGFPGYQSVSGWQDCANKCAAYSGANGEICEYWEHCAIGCISPPFSNICYFKKRNGDCSAPGKQTNAFTLGSSTAGTCPAPSGSNCGTSTKILSYI